MKKLENKIVFITGGLSGIGKECAIKAAKEGSNVVIADLKSDLTDITMAEIRQENSKAVFVECDVSVFSQVLLEYAVDGIRINAICPGFINTQLLTNAGISENTDLKKYIVGLHPMKRLGKSEEIASGFIFLASADNSFMTGTAIEIDGGYLAQ